MAGKIKHSFIKKFRFTILELMIGFVLFLMVGYVFYKLQSNSARTLRQGQWKEEMNSRGGMLLEMLKRDIKSMININEAAVISGSSWTDELKNLSAKFPVASQSEYIINIPYSESGKIALGKVSYRYDSSKKSLVRTDSRSGETFVMGDNQNEYAVEDFRLQLYQLSSGPYFIRAYLKLVKHENEVDNETSLELVSSIGIRYLNMKLSDPDWHPAIQNIKSIEGW